VDFSEELIKAAREQEEQDALGIVYHTGDASNLEMFENCSFDIVVCFMAIMDIKRYREVISEVGRVLVDSGRFLFNMPHPCFEVRAKDGELVGGWEFEDPQLKDPNRILFYKVDKYFDSGKAEEFVWKLERLKEEFTSTSFHRTLTEYSEALNNAGFVISRIREPKPSEEGINKLPILKAHLRIPHSIAIEAVKK